MALTAAITIALLFLSLLAFGVGWYFLRIEIFWLGVVLLLFVGYGLLTDGFQVISSSSDDGTLIDDNGTVFVNTTTTYEYTSLSDRTTEGLGLLCAVVAVGAGLSFNNHKKKKERESLESVEMGDV